MESDLDSILAAASSSDSDAPSPSFRRTVDDILNEDSSSSSSSITSSPPLPLQISDLNPPRPPSPPPPLPHKLATAASLPALGLRSHSAPRSLPSLFDRVRPTPRPGAAFAAAAAASRSVLTPHAAAIKSRRAESLGKSVSGVPAEAREETEEIVCSVGVGDAPPEHTVPDHAIETAVEEEELQPEASEVVGHSLHPGIPADTVDGKAGSGLAAVGNAEDDHPADPDSLSAAVEDGLGLGEKRVEETEERWTGEGEAGEESSVVKEEEVGSPGGGDLGKTEVAVIEERIPEPERAKSSRKADKKLRASMKPLEWAEELEKRQASSGLHWEEGAAAQPMRLKGIAKDQPAIGYMQCERENAITRTLSSQVVRGNHGSPLALALHLSFIAIGMSKGSVLVFPSKYSPHSTDSVDSKMLLLGFQSERPLSSVTSLCFNLQGDLLLVGYGNGHVVLWDVLKATAAKVIIGEHNSPVVHVAFLAEQFKAITGDSKGFLLLHTFSVVPLFNRYSVKSQYLVDGKKSETVLSVSPLHVSMPEYSAGFAQGNPTTSSMGIGSMMGGVVGVDGGWKLFNEAASQMDEGVVIFVTHKQALVVRLSPNFEPYDTLSKPEGVREGSLPYSSWRCTSRTPYKDDSDSGIPWLTIAWDKKVQIIKLVKTKLERYSEWNLDSAAIGVSWLDDQMLVILTSRGHLCLFTKDGTEIHRASFTLDGTRVDEAIAYHTHFINSFGNPEKAYNNSFAVRGATAYIIGSSHLIIARLLPWKERIQLLQRAGDWMGALNMSLRLYDGQAHGVIDLPRQTDEIRKVIMPFLSELLYSYVDEVFSYISVAFSNQVGKTNQHNDVDLRTNLAHEELDEQFARVGGVAVEFCLHVNRTDILFDEIFSKFMAVHHGGTFLEVLEPYILKDMLSSLPPEIMQALVEHYSSKGWLQRVEQCVLHMEISSLDFNQIIKLCREHGLYGALIYLFNKGLDDYKTPLEELLTVVKNLPKVDAISIGYRMLVYLKYCFLGVAFPPGHGSIPSSRQLSLTEELLQFLLENSILSSSPVMNTFKTTTGACPNFWFLLWLDVEATLDVLRLAFLDKVPSENAGDSTAERMEQPSEDQSSWSMAQKIVSSLIYLLDMESKETRAFTFHNNGLLESWPSKKDIGHVVDFIAFLVSCKQAVVSQQVVKHIMEYLTMIDLSSGENSQKSETKRKERQVVSLLNVLPEKDWNDSSLLNLFAEAHYYQACALIQTIRGQYIEALQSYMKDLHEPAYSFAFVHKMMLQLREPESLAFRAEVFSQLPELIKISREGAFFLVLDHFNVQATNILSELQLNSECLFLFLKTAIDVSLHGNLDFSALEISDASTVAFGVKVKSTPSDLDIYLERLSNFPKLLLRNPFHVTDEMVEQYLELLCQYESYSVLKFLKTFENYNLEHCLRLCQDHGITDAASFLLEMTGDVGGALAQAMSGLDENFLSIASTVQDTFQTVTIEGNNSICQLDMFLRLDQVQNVFDVLGTSISLCQRNSPRLVPQESESLWFRLLDRFSEPLSMLCSNSGAYERANTTSPSGSFDRQIKNISRTDSTLKRLFSRFIKEIVEGMIGYVALPAIMNKLLTDNGDQEFGDFKFTILGMLGTYGFEKRILDAAKSLIEDDTFYTMNLLKRGASHAYAPQSSVCCICGCSLSKDATVSGIRIFNCGHSTHLHCEPLENETSHVIRLTGCPVCMPKKEISSSRTRSSKMDSALVQSSTFGGRSTRTAKNSHHFHEPEQIERPYSTHHVPRFEILNSLKNAQRRLIDATPQLRLAPPAIYHDKVQKGTAGLLGESSRSLVKSDRSNKRRQQTDTKSKSLSNHFPLKATIFGSERTRTTHRHSHRT